MSDLLKGIEEFVVYFGSDPSPFGSSKISLNLVEIFERLCNLLIHCLVFRVELIFDVPVVCVLAHNPKAVLTDDPSLFGGNSSLPPAEAVDIEILVVSQSPE